MCKFVRVYGFSKDNSWLTTTVENTRDSIEIFKAINGFDKVFTMPCRKATKLYKEFRNDIRTNGIETARFYFRNEIESTGWCW